MTTMEDKVLLSSGMKGIQVYQKSKWRQWFLYYALCIVTLGAHYVVCRNFPWVMVFCKYRPAVSLEKTKVAVITDLHDHAHICKVKRLRILREDALDTIDANIHDRTRHDKSLFEEYVMFEYQQLRYVYNHDEQRFRMQHMDAYEIVNKNGSMLKGTGLDSATHRRRLIQFGNNHIDIKPVKKWKELLRTVTEPIHLLMFGLCVIILVTKGILSFINILYTLLNLCLNLFSIYLSYKQRSVSQRVLKDLAGSYGREMRVLRDGESFMAGSASLVPGDIVEITGRITLPCDMVLIRGSVEVDESMITGDTVTAQKIPYVHDSSSTSSLGKRTSYASINIDQMSAAIIQQENTLIGGSKTLSAINTDPSDTHFQGADPDAALAVVIRTGFNSSKGKIIREVLNSLRTERVHPYIHDTRTFSMLLVIAGLICTVLSVIQYCSFPSFFATMRVFSFFDALDLLLFIVPPFLPIMVNWPVRVANNRLKASKIQTTSLKSLLQFGVVDCVCYDKTGTLTEETLGFYGVLATVDRTTYSSKEGTLLREATFAPNVSKTSMEISEDAFNLMACCHNLTKINNDKVSGDRLEEALFAETRYELKREMPTSSPSQKERDIQQHQQQLHMNTFIVHPPPELNERGVIQVMRIFPFSSDLRRMSVVTRYPAPCLYSKGSPKSIQGICRPETIPKDYDEQIQKFGLLGFRIIAIARRVLTSQTIQQSLLRHDMERDMHFFGFIIMKNKLHHETISELKHLSDGGKKSSSSSSSSSSSFLRRRNPKRGKMVNNRSQDGDSDEYDDGDEYESVSLKSISRDDASFSAASIPHEEMSMLDDYTASDAFDDSHLQGDYVRLQLGDTSKAIHSGNGNGGSGSGDDGSNLKNKIRTIMITGDTAYTSIAAARECGMIDLRRRILLAEVDDGQFGEKLPRVVWRQVTEPSNGVYSDANTELVITGYAFSLLRNHRRKIGEMLATQQPDSDRNDGTAMTLRSADTIITDQGLRQYLLYAKLIVRANVFTEMLPLQKAELISDLKNLNYTVAMCGDGSNDSMALTAANVSLSLSEAETSYAAQFTNTENRHCVSFMIGDSRSLLDKIVHNFKFLAMFVVIQLCYMMQHNFKSPSQFQLLWSGFVMGFTIIYCTAFSNSVGNIRSHRPPLRIFRLPLVLSLAGQILVQVSLFALAHIIVVNMDWFKEYEMVEMDRQAPQELRTSFLFMFSTFQYLAIVFAFNFNNKFTRPWRNGMLIASMVALFLLNLFILWPFPPMPNTYNGLRTKEVMEIKFHFPNAIWVPFNLLREPADYEHATAYWIARVAVLLPLVIGNFVVSWVCEFLIQNAVLLWKDKVKQKMRSSHLHRRLMSLIMKRRNFM